MRLTGQGAYFVMKIEKVIGFRIRKKDLVDIESGTGNKE